VRFPALSLYVDNSLRGRELFFDGTFVRLPWPILFRSVGFTGANASWALFPVTDGTGASTCMGEQDNTLITYSSGSKKNLVGSVTRDGCSYSDPTSSGVTPRSPSPSLALNLRDRSKLLVTDSTELRLPYPITVYSFSFDGNANWTLYRGILFNGKAKCLYNKGQTGIQNFMDDEGEGYPIGSIIVGSIRAGCQVPSSETVDEDYETTDEDIYDYEDGYGKIAASANRISVMSVGLVLLAIISIF